MDPSTNLHQQQRLALEVLRDGLVATRAVFFGRELAELVLAYFAWRRAGGFAGDVPDEPDRR